LGGKTGRLTTVPIFRTTPPITATFPSLGAAAVTATIAALLANAGPTTNELVTVDTLVEAVDRAAAQTILARLSPAVPTVPTASAAVVSREAATVAAAHSLAALSVAGATAPIPSAGPDVVCPELSEQAGKAADGEGTQGLAAGCMVA
jgi:hypothetical protein